LKLIKQLAEHGCKKLNFAGGEPTLIPSLFKLINYARNLGLFVSLISNGTGISQQFLELCNDSIDIIGLSIDSASEKIEIKLGRTYKNGLKNAINYSHVELIRNKATLIGDFGIKLKVNTVLTPLNWCEDMVDLITELKPFRWKVLEVFPIEDVNNKYFIDSNRLKDYQINHFVSNHRKLNPILETNEIMMNSYCMITPDGRFYQNSRNSYNYSKPILKMGVLRAFNQVLFDNTKFVKRGGNYAY